MMSLLIMLFERVGRGGKYENSMTMLGLAIGRPWIATGWPPCLNE